MSDEYIAVEDEFLDEIIRLVEERDIDLSDDIEEKIELYKELTEQD